MRLLAISLLLFAGFASAQSPPAVDCDAIKNSLVPIELAYHSDKGGNTIVQGHRVQSGDYVVWSRQAPPSTSPNPPVFITKATYVDGVIASGEMWTTFVGKFSHRTATYTPDGLPENFDRRSDLTYTMHTSSTAGDNTFEDMTSTISYTFKSEGTAEVGSCVLQVIHGEIDAHNEAGRATHTFQLYFPELKLSASAAGAEPVVDGLSTAFSEIKPLN